MTRQTPVLSKDVETCGYCGKEYTSASELLQYDLCSSWVLVACEGLEYEQ